MFSYVCFARLHASMTWDVLDVSRDLNRWGKRSTASKNRVVNPVCKHFCNNIYYSGWKPFEQWWKFSFNSISSLQCLVACQSMEIHWWNYKEINCADILDFLGGHRAKHIIIVVASEGLSLLLTSSACKSEVAFVIWKWRKEVMLHQFGQTVGNCFSRWDDSRAISW